MTPLGLKPGEGWCAPITCKGFSVKTGGVFLETRQQRLRRGDPLEKKYTRRLMEMREEKQRGIVWQLKSAVCLERPPLIDPIPHDWEQQAQDRAFELARLLGRDTEKNLQMMEEWKLGTKKMTRKEKKAQKKDKEQAKVDAHKLKKGEGVAEEGEIDKEEPEEEEEVIQTKKKRALERVRYTLEEAKALIDELSPRFTEADRTNDRKSLERQLDET